MKRSSWSVILSATCVMLLWGSLFPAVKLGYRMLAIDTSNVSNLFLFAGVRFLLCGILLTVFCILKIYFIYKKTNCLEYLGHVVNIL